MRTMHEVEIKNMLRIAQDGRFRSYAPYSNFHVGACIKGSSGAYYLGCNIENAAYTPTNCAERTAVFKAVSEGEKEFEALAIIWDGESFATPCGVCRQVLAEFCPADMPIVCANRNGEYKLFSLGELLPESFTRKDME